LKAFKNKGLIWDNLYNFSLYYEVIGVLKNAIKYKSEYLELTIGMFLEELIGKVVDMQTMYETEKFEEAVKERTLRLQRSIEITIQAIAAMVEVRDPYSVGHQKRVGDLAMAIASQMGLSELRLEGIKMAGSVHDLGKIHVPVEILSKPGKLSQIEFDIIKTHPQVGFDLLKHIEFPWPIAQMVLQHHEMMDGSGYPQGLKGEKIMLEARILAVADVVEAMSSHRPYRPALGIEKALEKINKNKGRLYDHEVVDACLKIFEQGYKLPQA